MDRLRTLRWPVVAISLALSLAVLFGARWLLFTQMVAGPMTRLLTALPTVARFETFRLGGVQVVRLEVADVPDLALAYVDLYRGIGGILGTAPYRLEITDRRSPALQEALYRISPLVQEAMATGQFSLLQPRLAAESRNLGVDRARVVVDGERVYLQLHRGSEYLYEVFPRPDAFAPHAVPRPLLSRPGPNLLALKGGEPGK